MDPDTDLTAAAPAEVLSFVVPTATTAEWLEGEMAARHAAYTGTHSHRHPTYGAQGSDSTHEHMHAHAGDANHSHDHGDAAAIEAGGWEAVAPDLARLLASAHAGVPEGGSMVAAAMAALGSPLGLEQRGTEWAVLGRDGELATFGGDDGRFQAVAELARLAFADDARRPVLADTWRSEMCFEGVATPDGRIMDPGALAYRDCPMPLMLQTVNDVGHFGAVLAGAITKAGTVQQVALGNGEFDDTEAGRQALQIVEARDRFGVSIDGMFPAEYQVECVSYDDDGYCEEARIRFTLLTIGGLTMTPFPAFPDAYIALERRAESAAGDVHGAEGEPRGENDAPCEECVDPPATVPASAARARATGGVLDGRAPTIAAGREDPEAFTAAGEAAELPWPAEWHADPEFAVGDGRLVLQPDGVHYACPLTILADGRLFGHMASWFTCHTGYADRCVTPPRSSSGYAAFMLRPMMTASGEVVHVGHLSMGCGHAATDRPLTAAQVRAHYDGGPGAVRAAYVSAGEDEFGIWIAGGVNPLLTADQRRDLAACSVSGDWREVYRGRGLDLVACLAGVTVPGFPVASALAAAGLRVVAADDAMALPAEPEARFRDGRPTSLVAAGVVRRRMPWEALVASLANRVDELEARLVAAERVTSSLRPLAASAMLEQLEAVATNGSR